MSKFSSTTITAAPWSRADTAAARPAAPAPMTTTSAERFHSIRGCLGRGACGPHLDEAGLGVKPVSTRRRGGANIPAWTNSTADPHAEIARLEEQIEQLEARLESCRKFAAASRFAMALGGVLLLGLVFG